MMEIQEHFKEFENTTIPIREVVMTFGSDAQKERFKKAGKFKDKKREQPLLRTINQIFESVERVKKSNRVYYKLGKIREEIVEREDNRIYNGGTINQKKLKSNTKDFLNTLRTINLCWGTLI